MKSRKEEGGKLKRARLKGMCADVRRFDLFLGFKHYVGDTISTYHLQAAYVGWGGEKTELV